MKQFFAFAMLLSGMFFLTACGNSTNLDTVTIPTVIPFIDQQVASYEQVADAISECNLNVPEGRIESVEGVIQANLPPHEETHAIWADRNQGAEFNFYIRRIFLVNMLVEELDQVFVYTQKGLDHVFAADWLISEVERLTGLPFEETLLSELPLSGDAMSGYIDFLAISGMPVDFQMKVIGTTISGYSLTRSKLRFAERLFQMGIITDPHLDWWQSQEFWSQIPEN